MSADKLKSVQIDFEEKPVLFCSLCGGSKNDEVRTLYQCSIPVASTTVSAAVSYASYYT